MSTHTHIYNRLTTPILRLALLFIMIIGGMTEMWGQTYKYTVREAYKKADNSYVIFRTSEESFNTIWQTDFSTEPGGIVYSVQSSNSPQATVDIESGVLCFRQNGSSGNRWMNFSFTDDRFNVTETNWMLEFDWGASPSIESGSSGLTTSSVVFATNEGDAFTIEWESNTPEATIKDEAGNLVTDINKSIPIDAYNNNANFIPTNFSHFIITSNKNNGIYLTVTNGGTTYVNNVCVSSKFGYPTTFNGLLGRAYANMSIDNIKFSTFDNFTVPYRRYNRSDDNKLYEKGATNSEYKYTIPWPISDNVDYYIEYTESKDNVVYLSEAEDISGFTKCDHSNADARSSNAAAAYVPAGQGKVKLTTLNKGTYKINTVLFHPTSGTANWIFYTDDEEIANCTVTGSNNVVSATSSAFVIENDGTPIYVGEGGGNNNGIDLIYIQWIGESFDALKWIDENGKVVTTVNVDISEIDYDNRTSAMPSRLRNENSKNIDYVSSDNNVAGLEIWYDNNRLPRIKSIGTTVISAKNTSNDHIIDDVNLDVAKYTLNVTGARNVKGTYDKKSNTYSFNIPGQTANTATIEIEGVSMTYGFDDGKGERNNSTAVVVKNEQVGPILKVIDANGFSHPNLDGGLIPASGKYCGTYYVFKPTINGKLTITGQLSNAVVYQYNGSGSAIKVTDGNYGTSMTVSLTKGNTYYLYNDKIGGTDNSTPLLHSFSYLPDYSVRLDYENKINVDGTPSIDGFAFHKNVKLSPIISVVDNRSGTPRTLSASEYTVSYSIDQGGEYASSNSNGGILTTEEIDEDGLVTITAEVKVKADEETIKHKYTLMVLNGMWNFNLYDATRRGQLKTVGYDDGIYDNDPDVWSDNPNNVYPKPRDTKDFEYILCGGENANEPLDIARALQSANSVRWMRQNPGYFYMFGYSSSTYGRGGILKVPVRKGMVIEINGYSDSEHAEMLINNDGNLMHTETEGYSAVSEFDDTPVTTFFIEPQAASYRYLVTNPSKDGFVYIVNSSANLPFMINWIKLTTELLFEYGTETYTEAGTPFKNPVINGDENNTFKFKYTLTGDNASIDEDGNVTANATGTYTVDVTAEGGDLDGVKGTYTVHVINMTATTPVEAIAQDDLEWTAEDLKALITITGLSGDDLTNAINRVEFSEVSRKDNIRRVTLSGDVGNQSLVIDGVGEVVILAKLGNIEREITFVIKGGALADKSPVYPNTATSADIVVVGEDISNITFESEWMLENLLGDLANYKNPGRADELILTSKDGSTLTLSRKDGSPFAYGGAMPIRGTFVYNGATYNLTGMLTISYTSNSWKFDSNMLVNNHPTYQGVYNFYTDTTKGTEIQRRLGEWTTNATFDEPIDEPVIPDASQRHWKFIRKMGSNNPNTDIIYAYLSSVDGDNAMILPRSAGLIVNSSKGSDQFGVQMLTTRTMVPKKDNPEEYYELGVPNIVDIDTNFDGNPDAQGYDLQNMMFKVGGELTIPYVKPGQWIEMRWYRHTPDRGERMRLTNLCDVEGTPIKKTFRIGNTQQGTYMFQVGSHDGMVDEEQGYVNATFHIDDNTFISIQEVILHEPGWVYNSSMGNCLMQTGDDPEVQNQYITDGTERKFEFATHESHNAPTAPCDWQIKVYGDLDYTISDGRATNHLGYIRPEQFMPEKEAYIIVRDGWGKVYVTLNSYTSDYKYVVNRKTWTITFGVPPVQSYPYTWDFTKYYATTKTALGGDSYEDLPVQDDTTNGTEDENTDSGLEIVPREDEVDDDDYHDPEYYEDFDYIVGITDSYDETANPTGSREFLVQINTWNESDVEESVITTDYDSVKYGSFFVDGAQLVSLGLKETGSKGILPETAGLGFRVKNLGDKINDNVGILQLDMQSIVDGTETETDDGKAKDGATWRSGKLAIRGGGSIIVPRPDESGDKADDYYIYIRCSVAPDTVRNAVRMIAKTTDENITDNGINSVSEDNSEAIPVKETRDENYDVDESKGLYKYRFQKNDAGEYVGDVELKFNRDADIYVLAVTNIQKTMTAYNGAGWATESRDHEIDHTLTGYLTTNAAKAYAVLETDGNPAYSDNKAQTVVALKDTCHVAPAEYGLVMKQADVTKKDGEAYEDGETYTVPLFYPAITTSTDDVSASLFNLMRPNVTAKELSGETEEIDGDEYTRFILASRYLTWKRDEDGTLTKPSGYEDDPVVAFYRLHVFDKGETIDSNDDSNDATTLLNTMPANSAYLLLRSDMINDALWYDDSKSIKELFIGIESVSDMILAEYLAEQEDIIDAMPEAPVEIYNLRGQKLNANSQLEPGIYIMNGKKILIRKHNGQ